MRDRHKARKPSQFTRALMLRKSKVMASEESVLFTITCQVIEEDEI